MRYYRDIQPDETLQPGDERIGGNCRWVPVEAVWIGQPVPEDARGCFRRPVDLPVLQPVTPEAMAELESRGMATIVTCYYDAAWVYRWAKSSRWTADRRPATRPALGWFVDLSTIPEVQQ